MPSSNQPLNSYGKLENGRLIRVPQTYRTPDGQIIARFNTLEPVAWAYYGFKPVVDTPLPDNIVPYNPTYTDTGTEITVTWVREIHSPSPIEKLLLPEIQNPESTIEWENKDIFAMAALFPNWMPEGVYGQRQVVFHNGHLFACLHPMLTSAQNIEPAVPSTMWRRVGDPAVEYPDWIQPVGSEGLYSTGDKVTHNGKRWVSKIDNNGHEPSASAWAAWDEVV